MMKKLVLVILALFLLFSSKWQINAHNNKPLTQIILQNDSLFSEDKAKNTLKIPVSSITSHQINGKIVDYVTQQAIPNQLVFISKTNANATTDLNGFFSLKVTDSLLLKNDTILLKSISSNPADSRLNTNYPIKRQDKETNVVTMVGGAVSIVSFRQSKRLRFPIISYFNKSAGM